LSRSCRLVAVVLLWLAAAPGVAAAQGLTYAGPPLQGTVPFGAGTESDWPAIEYSPRADVFVLARVVQTGGERAVYTTAVDRSGRAVGQGYNVQGTALGDLSDEAFIPQLAYNSAADEFLVVWRGDSAAFGVQTDDAEIFARRLDARGRPLGPVVRVSKMGQDTGSQGAWVAETPDVAYHPARDEYVVVWDGTDDGRADRGECEVYGQRLDASGTPVGEDDFQISAMWPSSSGSGCGPSEPRVVHQPANDEYVVVWWGALPVDPYPNRIDGAWGQRLSPTGANIGAPVLITDPTQKEGYGGDLVANGVDGEYLVAWQELYPDAIRGRRLDAALRPLGPELAIFPPPVYPIHPPVLSFDPWRRHYVAAVPIGSPYEWWRELFAVLLDVTGSPLGSQIQVSDSPDPTPQNGPNQSLPRWPALAVVPEDGEHLAVWSGADPEPPLADMREIGSRRLRDPAAGTARPLTASAPRVVIRKPLKKWLRPLRRRELIAVVTCARPCRVRVVTRLRRIRYVRRLRVVGSRRVYLKLNARQRKALRRLGTARVWVTLRGRTLKLRVRR
jgi:hypothetical protein